MMTLLKLNKGQYSFVEEKIAPAAVVVGKAVRDLHLPEECVLAAIIRQGRLILPRGDTILEPCEEVLAVAHSSQLASLEAFLGNQS